MDFFLKLFPDSRPSYHAKIGLFSFSLPVMIDSESFSTCSPIHVFENSFKNFPDHCLFRYFTFYGEKTYKMHLMTSLPINPLLTSLNRNSAPSHLIHPVSVSKLDSPPQSQSQSQSQPQPQPQPQVSQFSPSPSSSSSSSSPSSSSSSHCSSLSYPSGSKSSLDKSAESKMWSIGRSLTLSMLHSPPYAPLHPHWDSPDSIPHSTTRERDSENENNNPPREKDIQDSILGSDFGSGSKSASGSTTNTNSATAHEDPNHLIPIPNNNKKSCMSTSDANTQSQLQNSDLHRQQGSDTATLKGNKKSSSIWPESISMYTYLTLNLILTACESLIVYPQEVLKTRLQVSTNTIHQHNNFSTSSHSESIHISSASLAVSPIPSSPSPSPSPSLSSNSLLYHVKSIYTTQGLRGFYTGYLVYAFAQIPCETIYRATYNVAKHNLQTAIDHDAHTDVIDSSCHPTTPDIVSMHDASAPTNDSLHSPSLTHLSMPSTSAPVSASCPSLFKAIASQLGVPALAGFSAEIASVFVWVPQDIITQNMMVARMNQQTIQFSNAVIATNANTTTTPSLFKKGGVVDIVSNMYKNHGIRVFFRGAPVACLTYGLYSAIWWLSFEKWKTFLTLSTVAKTTGQLDHQNTPKPMWLHAIQLASAGAFSGCFACFLTNPLDVAKTRFQTNQATYKATSVFSVLYRMTKYEGLSVLTRGVVPRLAAIIPASILLACSSETVLYYSTVDVVE